MFGLLNTTQIYGIQTQQQEHEQKYEIAYQTIVAKGSSSAVTTPTASSLSSPSSLANTTTTLSNTLPKHRRSQSTVSDSSATLSNTKSPTNFLEKLLKTDLLNTYDTLRNYRNTSASHSHHPKRHSDPLQQPHHQHSQQHHNHEGILNAFNCLQGSYRHSFDGEFYEKVEINSNSNSNNHSSKLDLVKSSEMTIKCSKNLLAIEPEVQGPATLQNYQKIPESDHDLLLATDSLVASSGASSGEFNSSSDATSNTQSSSNSGSGSGSVGGGSLSFSSSSSNLYKRLSFGGRNSQNSQKQEKNVDSAQAQHQRENGVTHNSVALNLTSSLMPSLKVIDLHRSSSSTSSSGDFLSKRDRKKGTMTPQPEKTPLAQLLSLTSSSATKANTSTTLTSALKSTPTTAISSSSSSSVPAHEKSQRRKLLQMLAAYEQQNKLLQRELAKEKRRRSEELACVVKSLLCFESKLKTDMKSVNLRLQEKDVEICRLVRQNRALRKKLYQLQDCARDEGVVEDDEVENEEDNKDLLKVDCLHMEALQCQNCQRQFYDIEVQENSTQTTMTMAGSGGSSGVNGAAGVGANGSGSLKDASGSRNNDDPTTEHGSSSDDTVSSSFFGARRSVRYTSKRTSGTFRDYMRSRAMNIDDPALENDNNSEEYPSTLSRDDSSHETLHIYSRTIERMHGVKCDSERDSEHSGHDTSSSSLVTRSNSRASTKSSKSSCSKASDMSNNVMEEDDGIFSPTQDEDFEEEDVIAPLEQGKLKIVRGSALEAFSEASPKQIYETSTDDWYASASDQEEISSNSVASKSYGQGAVNPVLECVNQILLQQSMEGIEDRSQTPKNSNATLPRRSSLSDRRNHRSNSRASDGANPNSRNGTLTRKRVHFSTKNSMVHVPRNDETEDEDDEDADEGVLKTRNMISSYQGMVTYISHTPAGNMDKTKETEHLEVLNYESIYSNEYEPIGSELNSSNLYVDMESAGKAETSGTVGVAGKLNKLPPALPPKPANLLKFKKSLQQLDESPDELVEAHSTEILVEPDYCSISEVNVGITSVQIRADIHRAPLSERDLESVVENEQDLDAATVVSEALSQKTEEIEEIFADIPKLPNVAAIIAPKSALKQNDYLIMTPKSDTKVEVGIKALTPQVGKNCNTLNSLQKPDRSALKLNLNTMSSMASTPIKSSKMEGNTLGSRSLPTNASNYQQQLYKRKHMPNILQEINKRLSLPNSPITPTPPAAGGGGRIGNGYNKSLNCINDSDSVMQSLPLQAEFDWYNLDAEYGKNSQTEHTKVCDILGNGMSSILADIKEDGESLINAADEYNLDEEYGNEMDEEDNEAMAAKAYAEAINPLVHMGQQQQQCKAKKIKKNLANFEKFIENTGSIGSSNNKPLPSKRKIYFAGPFV